MEVNTLARRQGRRLLLSIFLNLGFALIELIGGLFANSLVLVAGALHDAGDTVALVLSWLGLRLSLMPPNRRRTFGYRKVRILITFVNALALGVLTVLVVRTAILRIFSPEPVKGGILLLMAVIGIIINGAAVLILRQEWRSLNIRSAMWHLLDDLLGFLVVLVGGVAIQLTGLTMIDPLLSIAVGVLVLYGVWRVFREATSILIDSTPRDLDYEEVRRFIASFSPQIQDVHDLHIWTLGEEERALMAHLAVTDGAVSSFQPLLFRLNQALRERFNIQHITLELECDTCKSCEDVCL